MTTKSLVIRPSVATEVKVAKIERNEALLKAFVDFTSKTMDTLVLPIASSPVTHMIAGAAFIEWMQTWKIGTGEYAWQSQPGTHAKWYGEITKPLFSQSLATALEAALISTEVLSSLGGGGFLSSLIALLTKRAS